MEWWRDMFAAPLWQHLQLSWERADDADEDAERVGRALRLGAPSRVLDVPCGTGRIARRLVAAGHDVVGVDATERFLVEADEAGVPSIRADMRTTVVRPGSFDAAICFWGSFGYFDDDGNRAQARALVNALAPGGRCLVDTVAADTLLPRFEAESEWDLDDTHVDESREWDEASRRIRTTWTFTRGHERSQRVTSTRLYSVEEFTDIFSDAGCTSFEALDDELRPFGAASMRLWLVAAVPDA